MQNTSNPSRYLLDQPTAIAGNQLATQNWTDSTDPTLLKSSKSSNLVILSGNIADVDTLIAGVNADYEVAVLDSSQDGVAQISQILASHTGLTSLHIVSHGAAGSLHLGGTNLNVTNLDSYSGQIQNWSSAFAPGADILLYGCDVAAGVGADFVQQISQLTGTDVAASVNATGSATAGGDWDLEFATGTIASPLAFQSTVLAAYSDLLAPFVNYANFASTTGLQLNGNAAQSGNVLRLTPDQRSQRGTAFATQQIGITGDTSFNTQFQFRLSGTSGSGGADGITFMLQNSGVTALGGEGGSLGYGGIGNSLAIEFDTFQGTGDIDNNHVSILQGGVTTANIATRTAGIDLNSGNPVNAWVDYNGTTNRLDVYLSSTTVKPGTALLSATVDLPTITGAAAFAGFSGGTGFITNAQDIQSWTMDVSGGTPVPNGTGDGLRGEYYDNIDFTNLKVSRVDPTVNFDWGTGSPDPTIGVDTFSARWTGKVQPRYSEAYTFYTLSDDGVRLTVNGQRVIDNFTFHAPTEDRGTPITLQAGQEYDIVMEYFEGQVGATAKLSWSSASQGKEIIPRSQLYSGGTSTQGSIALAQNTFSVNEGGGSASINVVRTGNSSGTASIKYRTFDGTATSPADYTGATDLTLTFAPGETSKTISIPIINDTIAEGNETFSVTIDRAEGASLGTIRTATVTIVDNDVTPGTGNGLRGQYYDNRDFTNLRVTRVDPTVDFNFGGGSPDPTIQPDTFSVIWTGQVQPQFNETYTFYTVSDDGVRLSVNGQQIINNFTDHAPTEDRGTITLQAGQKYDIRMEYYENGGGAVSRLLWSSPSQAKQVIPTSQLYAPATGSPGQLAFSQPTYTVNEDGTNATIAVTRTDGTDGAVTVRYATSNGTATAGSDYTATSGTLTFAAGESTKNITVPITNDTAVEKDETVNLTLSTPGGGATLGSQTTAVLKIVDNDPGNFQAQTFVSTLTSPTAMDFTPDGKRIYVAEKSGIVRVIDNGVLLNDVFIDLSDEVNNTRDRGLLGIAVDPKFDQGRPFIYLSYTYDPPEADRNNSTPSTLDNADANGNRPSRLVRVEADAANGFRTAKANTKTVILGKNSTWANTSRPDGNSTDDKSIPPSGYANGQPIPDYLATDSESHSIGQIRFGKDGKLFVSNGDGTSYNNIDTRAFRVQDIDSLSGKMLRIDPDTGNGLPDNPFYNVGASVDPDTQYNNSVTSNRSKVYSLGLRNPFKFTVNQTSGEPFIGDVGFFTWEEIDTGRGKNFGWPFYEGGANGSEQTPLYKDLQEAKDFYASGKPVEAPILARSHPLEGATALIMGDFYTGTTYPSVYNNALFFSDANTGRIFAATFDSAGKIDTVKSFANGLFGVVQMQMGPDGNLYYIQIGNLDVPNTGLIGRWVPGGQGNLLSGGPTPKPSRLLFDARPKSADDVKR
jgi:glucose/arabinose dehydrogenase